MNAKKSGRVTLGAAITADGKLAGPLSAPGAWPEWCGPPQAGDAVLVVGGRADPVRRLRELWTQTGTRRVVCFGDSRVFRRLFEAGAVAEVFLLVLPAMGGRRGAATLSGPPGEFFPAAIRCRLLKMEVHGRECLLHYRVLPTPRKRDAAVGTPCIRRTAQNE